MIKLAIRRWYIALAVRLPGHATPACIGFGLPRYEREARRVAIDLAEEIAS
jgi:hypothetical protein